MRNFLICSVILLWIVPVQAQTLPDFGEPERIDASPKQLIAMATAPHSGLIGALELEAGHPVSCRVWSETGRELWGTDIPGNAVHSIGFGREGQILAVGGVGAASWMMQRRATVTNRGTVRVFDARSGKMWRSFPMRRNGYIHSIAVAPHAPILAVAGNSWIDLWDYSHQRLLGSLKMSGEVTSLCFSPDGELLAAASLWSLPTVWHVKTRKISFTLPYQGKQTFGVAFSPDSNLLALAGYGFLSLYDLNAQQRWKVNQQVGFGASYSKPSSAITFSRDGKWIAISATNSTIYETRNGQSVRTSRFVSGLQFGKNWLWGVNGTQRLRWPTTILGLSDK